MRSSLLAHDRERSTVPVFFVNAANTPDRLAELGDTATVWARTNGFDGGAGQLLIVPDEQFTPAAVLFGVKRPEEPGFTAGDLARKLPAGMYRFELEPSAEHAAALGFALGAYRYARYRQSVEKDQPAVMVSAGCALADLFAIIDGVGLTRDLINTPASDMGPAELAKATQDLFARHGGVSQITEGDDLLEAGFPMVHAVGRASDRAPRLVDAKWGDENHPKITLVGKGVVFDTGGLDIKPANAMALMKKDMGGAANVLGLAAMIMAAGLAVRLRVIIPAVENAISGSAFRPGDVLASRKGVSVEIGNTDAEGRLVLADALALADEEKPDLLIDMATLTGAARVAMGPELPPIFTDDDAFAAQLSTKGGDVDDPVWRLPLWRPYERYLDSRIADINHINTTGVGFAGAITAALFLARFVENAKTWAHFDIYGWSPSDRPGHPQGGEAQAIRALFALLQERYPANAT